MEFNELIAELRAASENLPNDSADRSLLSSLYCNKACKAIDRISEDLEYNNVITGLWLVVAHFAEQLAYLKPVPALSELCFKLFRQCAKSVLNIQWQNLEEDSSVRQNFLVSLANLHTKLIPFDFPRFRLLDALTENPWTNPTLAKVMGGEVEDGDKEEVRSYIEQEDPIILQLRVDMMLRENCEEYALNLCNSCLTHPELQTDLSIRKIQLSLLYKLGHEDRLQEECQKLSIQDALRIIKQLQTSQPHRQLCTVLAQTFMVQNWIRPSDMEANKELLRLWIRQQLLVDREQDQFKESVWAMAKLSQSTEQIVIFIDVLREECGDVYLQLYVDMCIFAINVDKGQMETNIKEGNMDAAIARRSDMASICAKLSCLCHHTSLKVARICALTSFTLRPSEQSFTKIGTFYGQAGGCCNKCGLEKNHEPGKVNPATLYEVERLLNMLRPDYLNPENSFSNIQALCRRFLHESVKNAQMRNQQVASGVSILSVTQMEGPGKKKIMQTANKPNTLFEALTPQDIQNTQSLLNKMRLQSMPPPKPTHLLQNTPRLMNPSGSMRPNIIQSNQQTTAFKPGPQNKQQYMFDAEKVKSSVPFGVTLEQQQYYALKREKELEVKQKYAQKRVEKPQDSLGANIQISQQPSSVMLQNQIKQKQLLQRNAQVSQMIQSAMRQDSNVLQSPDIVQAVLNIMKGNVLKQTSSMQQQQTLNHQMPQTSSSTTQQGTQPLPTVSTLLRPTIHSQQLGQPQQAGQPQQRREQPSPRKYPRPQLYAQPIIVSTSPSLTSLSNRSHITSAQISRNSNLHGINVISTMSSAQRQGTENQMSKSQADSIRQYMQMSNIQKQIAEQRQMSGSTVTLNNVPVTRSLSIHQVNVGAISRPKTTVELAEQASLAKQQEKLANYQQQVRTNQAQGYSHTNQRLPKNNQQQFLASAPNQQILMSQKHLQQQNNPFNVNNCHQSSSLTHNQALPLPPSDELSGSITGIDDTIIKELLQDSGILANTFPDIEVDNIGEDKSRKISEQTLNSSQHNLSLQTLDPIPRAYSEFLQTGVQFPKYSLASSAATSQSACRTNQPQHISNASQISHASIQQSNSLITKNPNMVASNQPVNTKVSQPYIDNAQNRLQRAFNQQQFSMKPTVSQLQRDTVGSHVAGQPEQKPTMDQLREMMKKEDIEGEICMDSANNATYRCIICSSAFETLDALREHVRNVCKPGLQSSSVYNSKIKQDRANSAKAGVETTTVFQCLRCFELCVSDVGIKEHRLTCKRVPTVPSDLKKDAANKNRPSPRPSKPLTPKIEPRDNSNVVPELPLPFPYPSLNAGAILKSSEINSAGKQLSSVPYSNVNMQQPPTSCNVSYPQTCVTLASSGSQSVVVTTSYNSTPPGGTYNPPKYSRQNHVQTNNHENQASIYNFAPNVSRSNTPMVSTGANINNANVFNVKTGTGAPVASHVVVNLDQSTLPAVNKEIVNKSAQVPNISTMSVSSVTLSSASTVSNMPHSYGALLPVSKETVSSSQTPSVLVPHQLKEVQGPSKKIKEKLIKPKVKKLPPPSFTEISGSGGCKFYKCDLCSQTLCSLESFVLHWEKCATKNKAMLRRRASREKLLNAKPMTGEVLENVLSVIANVAAGSGPLEVQLADNESDADSRLVSLLDPCTTDNDLIESNEMDNSSWVEEESPNNVPDERDSICHEGSEEDKDVFSEASSEKDSVDDSVEYKQRRRKYVESDEDDDDNSLSESDQNLAFVSTRDAPPKLRDRKTLKPIHSFINETFLSPYYKGNAKSDGDKLGEEEDGGEEKTPSPTSDEVDSEGDGLSCTVCRTTYQTKRMLLQHCAGKHLKPYTVKTLADSSSYFCHLCQKTFSTFMHFMQHVPNHSVTIYEKMKSYAASRKLLQHSQRIATQRGFMKKGGLSPKMAKALKSKKAAKKSAVDKLKRELLSSSTHSVRETLRLSKRKRSLCQRFTSSEEDYSTDASNSAVIRSKRAGSESSLLRGISLRGRGRPRKQSSIEEASSTEDSGPKLAKSPDHDYVASDDAYDSDISLERAPPITRSRKRSNQTAFHSSISKINKITSFSEDLSEINGDDSESGTGSRLSYKKIVSEAGVIEFDSDSNSATLTFVQHNNGSLIPVSDTESPDINTSQGAESIIPELDETKNPPRKITVRSLSRRLKEKLKSCDLHPTIVLEALTSENIDNSTGDCKSKEPKSETTVSYKCSFLDSFLSYLNHYPNPTDNKNTKSSHVQKRSGPTEQRKKQNFDDKSLSTETGGSPVIRSRSSSIDGSVTSTDPGSLADTEGSTISYSTGSEKESGLYTLQKDTSSSGDMKSFLARFPTRRCSVNLGRKINADSLCLNTCANLTVDKSIDLESPTAKEKILDDTRKTVKVALESSGGAIIRPVEPVVRLRRISVPVGDCSQVDLPGIMNTKNVGKGKEEQISKNSNHEGVGPAECDDHLKSHCMRSASAENKYYCSASWHEQNTKKMSQTNIFLNLKCSGAGAETTKNILYDDIQAIGDYSTKDKTKVTGKTTSEPDTLSIINTKSSDDGSLTGSINTGSDCAKNVHSNEANDCVYIQNIPKFLDDTGDEKNIIIERNYDDEEECMEPSGESDDFYIVKESSDHELDDSELSEEEPNTSREKEPNVCSDKAPNNSSEKEPNNSSDKAPNNSSEKEPKNSSEKEPNNSIEKEANNSSEKAPKNSSEKEPNNSSENEPNNSSENEPNNSSEKEPNNSSEKEPNNSSEKEPNNSSEKEANNSSEKEANNSSEKAPNNSSEKEPNNSSDKAPNNSCEKEPNNSSEKEPNNSSEKEHNNINEKDPNNSSEKEPNNSSEKEPNDSSDKEPNISSEKEPNNSSEKEPNNSSEKEPNNSSEKEPNNSSEKEPNNSSEREPNYSSEKEPNNSSEKEPNDSSDKEPNISSEKEPNNSSEKEPNNSSEKEPNNSSEKEPNNSSEKEPNNSSEKEPNNSSEKELNNSSDTEPNNSCEKEPNNSSEKEPNASSDKEPNASSDKEPNASSDKEPNNSIEKEHNSDDREPNANIDKEPSSSGEKELNNSSDKEHNVTSDREPNTSSEKADFKDETQNTSIFEESSSVGNGLNHANNHLEFKQTPTQGKKEKFDNNDAQQTFPDNFVDSLHTTSHSEKDTGDPKDAPNSNFKNEDNPEVSSMKNEGQNRTDVHEIVFEVAGYRPCDNGFEQLNTARYVESSEMSVKNLTDCSESIPHSNETQLKDVPNTDPKKQIVDILNFSQPESPRDVEKLSPQEFNNEIDQLPKTVLNTDIVNITQEFASDIKKYSQELNDFENGVLAHPILDKGNLHIQHRLDERNNQNMLPTPIITSDANQQSVSLSLERETNDLLQDGHAHSNNQIKYPPTCSKNSIQKVLDSEAISDMDMSELPKGSANAFIEDVGVFVPKCEQVVPINVDDAKNTEPTVSGKQFSDVAMEMGYIQNHTSPPTSETFSISEKTNTNVDNLTELSVSTKLLGIATKDSPTLSSSEELFAITSMDSVPSSAPKEINTSSHMQTLSSDSRKSTPPKRTKIEKTTERGKSSEAMVRNPNISLAAFIHERLLTKEKASTSSPISDRNTIDDNKEKIEVQFNILETERSLGLGLVDYSSSDDEKEGSSSDENDCESSKVVGTDNVPSSSKPLLDEWNSTQYPADNGKGNNVYTFHCITDTPQPQPVLKLNSALYSHSVFMPSNSSSTTGDLKQMLETHSVRIENAGRNGHFQLLEEKGCHSNTGFNGLDKKTDMTKSLKTLHCEIIVHMSEVDQANDPHSRRDCSDVADSSTALITEQNEIEPMCNILSREKEHLSLWRSQSPGVSESNDYAKREFQSLESTPDRLLECKRIVSQNFLMSTPVDDNVRMSQDQNLCGFNKHDDILQHLSNDDDDLKTCPSPRDNPTTQISEPFHITGNDDEVNPAEVVVQIVDETFINNKKSSFIPVHEEPIDKNDIAEVEKNFFESKCKNILKSCQILTQNNEMSTYEDTTKLQEENSSLGIEKSEQDTKHFDYFFEDEVNLLSPCTGITTEKSEDETPKKCMAAYGSVDFTNYNEGQLQSSDGEDFSEICSTSALPNENGHVTMDNPIINDTLGNVIVDVNSESMCIKNVAAVSAIKDSENLKEHLATEPESQDLTSQDTHFPAPSNTGITGYQNETDYLDEQISEAAVPLPKSNKDKADEEHYCSDIFKNGTCDKNQQSLHQIQQANQDAPFNETENFSEVLTEVGVGASEEATDKEASQIKGQSGGENNVHREVGDCCSQTGSEAVAGGTTGTEFGYQIEEEIKRGNPMSEESERHSCEQKPGLEMDVNNKMSESGDQVSDILKRRKGHHMSPETECCNKMQTEEGSPHSYNCSLVLHSFNSSVKFSGDVSSSDNCKKTLSCPVKPFKEDDSDKSSTSSDPDEDFDLIIENDTSSRNLISFKSSPEKKVFPEIHSTVGDIKPLKRILTKAFAHTHTATKKNEYQKVILAKKPLRKTSQEQFKWDDDEESKTPGPITGHLTFTIGTSDAVKISMGNDHATNDKNVQKQVGKRKVLQEKTETSPFISSMEDSSLGKTEKVTATISQSVTVVGGKPKRLIQKKRSYSPSDHRTPEIQAKIKKTNSANKQNRSSNRCVQKRSRVDKLIVNKRETVEFVHKGAEDLASANNNSIAVDDEISFKKDSFSTPTFEPQNCLPSISTSLATGGDHRQQRNKAKSHKSSLSGTAHVISIPLEVKAITNNIHTEEALHKTQIGLRSRHSSVESNKSDRSSSSKRQTDGNSQTAAKRGRKSEDSSTPMWQKIGLIKITPNTPNVASCAENAPMTRSSEAAMKAYNQKSLRNREVNPLDPVSASSPTLKGGQTNVSSRSLVDKGRSLVISKMAHMSSAKHSPITQPKSVGATKISKRLNDTSPLAAVVKRRVAPVPSRQSQVKTSVKGTRPVTTSATVYVVDPVPNTPSSEISKKSSFVGARTIHTQLPSGTVIKPKKSVRHQNLSILKGTKADTVKRHRRKT